MESRFDLLRKLKQPENAGWVTHGSFRDRANAERLMKSMERDKPFQDYKIIDSEFIDAKPWWMDEAVKAYIS